MGIISFIYQGQAVRLDVFLSAKFSDKTRTFIKKLILSGAVKVNGEAVNKPAYLLKAGNSVVFDEPDPVKPGIKIFDRDIEIIYEDEYIAAVNKPAGISSHPGKGNYDNTLVNILMGKISNLSGIGGVERPGIVHRLDKDTSSIMLIAKNDFADKKTSNLTACP